MKARTVMITVGAIAALAGPTIGNAGARNALSCTAAAKQAVVKTATPGPFYSPLNPRGLVSLGHTAAKSCGKAVTKKTIATKPAKKTVKPPPAIGPVTPIPPVGIGNPGQQTVCVPSGDETGAAEDSYLVDGLEDCVAGPVTTEGDGPQVGDSTAPASDGSGATDDSPAPAPTDPNAS